MGREMAPCRDQEAESSADMAERGGRQYGVKGAREREETCNKMANQRSTAHGRQDTNSERDTIPPAVVLCYIAFPHLCLRIGHQG